MRVKTLTTFWQFARGYLFRSSSCEALLFCFSKPWRMDLHTFFVFFALDIYYLDAQGKVLLAYRRVRPFRFFVRGVKASYILETALPTSYKVGDCINVSDLKRQPTK